MEVYEQLEKQVESLVNGSNHWVTDLANVAACLYHGLSDVNWAGFYLRRGEELVLGPFQGRPACSVIALGKGVCGTAAAAAQAIVVPDVHAFPGHIACDPLSRSELVVPIVSDGFVVAVIDVDSPLLGRFTTDDRDGLWSIAKVLSKRVMWRSCI